MAHALSEQQFTSYEDTKNLVGSWIASKDKEFFRLGIRPLREKWKKYYRVENELASHQIVGDHSRQGPLQPYRSHERADLLSETRISDGRDIDECEVG
ncbi:Mariner Mos1 transposase [Eumeta japonica]|uniref:Mariner Mos1 transposase n=1 Tax=Eumeta variegata TaxID=151549 RepID=A0A4C1SSR4_EUMVA|nr:Mariner Mos1 transposase [Eumeta japonica]